MRRALPLAAVAACLVLPATAAAQTKIQPGASMEICTLNFIYDGLGLNAGKVYVGTAAHCAEKVGDTINDGDGEPIGTVAFIDDAAAAATDYAFVEVLPSELGRVDPAMKGHPGYPTGYTVPEETEAGDAIQLSGFGIGFGETQPTQEQRQALLLSDDEQMYQFNGPSVNGDSGGPLVHVPTGKALGIVSRYGTPPEAVVPSSDLGPTLQGILDKAAAKGFPVRLRLAGETGPPAAPAPAPPPPAPAPAQPAPAGAPAPAPAAAPDTATRRATAARKARTLKRCRRKAKRIKRPAKRRAALRRCARAARR